MEIIKKKVYRIMTTGTTENCSDKCRVIIPDLNVIYSFKIGLISETKDIGFLDAYVPINAYSSANFSYNEIAVGIGESLLMDNFYI